MRITNLDDLNFKHVDSRRETFKTPNPPGQEILSYKDSYKNGEEKDVRKPTEIEKELELMDGRIHSIRKALSVLNEHLESVLNEGNREECEPVPDYQPSSKLGSILHNHAHYLRNIEEDIYVLIDKITL